MSQVKLSPGAPTFPPTADLQPRDADAPFIHRGAPGDEMVLAMIAWVLMLLGWGVVGLIIAYIDRAKRPPHVQASCRYLIRTFWIGCLVVALVGAAVLVGFGLAGSDPGGMRGVGIMAAAGLVMLVLALWHIARCIKAIVLLARERPIAHPGTWLV